MLLFINEIFSIGWKDVIDIILVAYLIYAFYNLIRGTAALNIFLGILTLYLIWKLVDAIGLNMLTEILGQFIGVGVLALIIVFQQEIRKFLLLLGSQRIIDNRKRNRFLFWKINVHEELDTNIDELVDACVELSKKETGALIIITDRNELADIQLTGIKINADLSKELLHSIFFKNSPLHDGAVIILKNKIVAAKCILPVSSKDDLPEELGLRHRAAIGITENSDAMAIIVSEQNGNISTAYRGHIKLNISDKQLKEELLTFVH